MASSGVERAVSEAKSALCWVQIFYHSLAAPLKSALVCTPLPLHLALKTPLDYRPPSQDSGGLTPWRHGSHACVMLWESATERERDLNNSRVQSLQGRATAGSERLGL